MRAVFLICALLSVLAVLLIVLFLLISGVPAIAKIGFFKFIFGAQWLPESGQFGIFPFLIGTVFVTVGAVIIGVIIGVFSAVFISRFCPKRYKKIFTRFVTLLAGIPSVIYGLFGIIVVIPIVRIFDPYYLGYGVLSASVILGLMILPTVISISKNALDSVPASYYEGALALGSTHEQAVFKVVVPAAKSGIYTSIVLGIGRALGETMAVVMVVGNGTFAPLSLIQPMRTLTANIVLEMNYATGLHSEALVASGVILFVLVLILNLTFSIIRSKRRR
jgi:phosphate transport system permease protein